jgi:PadR family transcriptional regulator PadR
MKVHLGEFEQLLLLALVRLGDGAYGVEIRQEIEKRTGRSISAGAVYTALDRMESRGFVSSEIGEPTPQRGGRRKNHYTLEPAGARALSRSYQAICDMAKGMEPKLSRLGTGDLQA